MTNARNNAKSAVKQAQNATVALDPALLAVLAKLTPAQIASLTSGEAPKAPETAKPAKQEVDFQTFKGKVCKVIGGRKHVGKTFKVYHVTKGSERRKPVAICEGDTLITKGVTPEFVNPAHLEIVGDMKAEDVARLDKFQKEQSEETLYVAATAKNTSSEKAILLSNPRWVRDVYFSKNGMISLTGFETPDGDKIFEVAAWQVRKQLGISTYDELVAQQPALAAIVEAKA